MSEKEFITQVSGAAKGGFDYDKADRSVTGYTYSEMQSKNEKGKYDFGSPETIDPDDSDCFSKKIEYSHEGSSKTRYYVKVGTDGFIFNPWGMFSEGTQARYAKNKGRSEWKFQQVNEKCFEFYNRFLQSRNSAWLTNAEREK